ncbi:MAG: sulfatase-like hydrolase/transferase, partial [Candidatus Eisenbacteria bacterium]|nr:sulfatase-like hydrolase/transferase [Candidatus Eisenbacteria bacterium]
MQLWRRWLSWTATGLVVGFLVGAVLTFTAVRAHHYVQYGMSWLIVDTTARLLERGTLVGTAAGLALGLTLVICGPPVRYGLGWVSRRVASLRIEDERNVASLIGAILTGVVVLVAGWIVLNERFIPFQYGRRYWVLNVGWGVGSIIGTIVLYRLLLQVPILPWLHRRGRGILWATCVPLLVVLGVVHVVRIVKRPMPPAGAPSIILLTVDTTRADHLSVYGYSRRTTPHLEELAKEGRVYAYCYSHAPVTSSSFSCIMSGHRPKETGTYGNDPVPDRVNTLAEYLANAGYETAAVVSNFVLKKSKNHSQGYRYYDDAMDDRE